MYTLQDTREVTIGQYVKSKAGRDKDKIFIIIDIIDDLFVLVADGDLRRVEKPKKKKIKHLSKFNLISEEVQKKHSENKKITNLIIRREIEKLGQSYSQE